MMILADSQEITQYCRMDEIILYIRKDVIVEVCFVASKMQQRLDPLKIGDLLQAKKMVREILSLKH